MSFKTTGILLFVLALMGGYVYTYVLNAPKPPSTPRPYVYQYDMEDIVRMDVTSAGSTVKVVYNEDSQEWRFEDASRGQVDQGRLNGIRLLLSGPGANRVLLTETPTPQQLAEYGFNNPQAVANLTLKDGSLHQVLLGDQTPDGKNYYIKNGDTGTVYLVDYTWGNEIKRFVSQPPIATPTAAAG